MKSLWLLALTLGATTQLWPQALDAASDRVVVVGNRAQPVQWNHRETIADAIAKAQPNGTVIIPSSYQGTDCNPLSNCNLGSVTVIDWRAGGGSGAVAVGTQDQVTVQNGQIGLANPLITPGPVIIPGPSTTYGLIPQTTCLGPLGADQLSSWNDGSLDWPMFYDGTADDCSTIVIAKTQANGYSGGQILMWTPSERGGRGGFAPPPTVRGFSFNTTLGYYVSKRATTGCTTGASAGNNCASPITVTWPSTLPNSNYSVSCTGVTPTNVPSAPYVTAKTATSITVNYFAITAAAASWASVDCIAMLD